MRFLPAPFIPLFAGMMLSVAARAQTALNGQTPAARLEQLDETYSSNLRRYHAPIIQEYLVTLEKLKQTISQRGRIEGTAAVQAEIESVKKIIRGSGLLPYDVLESASSESKTESAPALKPAVMAPPKPAGANAAIIFAAAAARKSSPDTATLAEKPDGRAVPVGAAEWQVDKIAAGDYRISILYSCGGKPADSTILASIGLNTVQHALTAANATGGVNEFRIARLGVISLEKDLAGESLVLRNSDPASAAIWVRQVIIAKVTESGKK